MPASSTPPLLSVVLITPDNFETVRRTVRHLCAQTIAHRIELVLCAPASDSLALDHAATAPLHSVRVVETGPLTVTGPARAAAARAASAPVVAYAEEHCYPDPTWGAELLAAHASSHAAVGPAVRNANPEHVVSWADLFVGYGRWMAPGRAGTVAMLPGHNTSYKREVLLAFGPELDALMEAETVLFWKMRRRGHTLYFAPRAAVAHLNFSRWSVWLRVQWHLGRSFAALRAERWWWARRAAFALAAPLIPFVRLSHMLGAAHRNGVPRALVARALPAVLAGLAVDAAAQAAGSVLGAGRSVPRLTAFEFHRERANRGGHPAWS